MASKQLGKFRQWAGEVISSRDKTTVNSEFRELERDIERRKDGAQRLLQASELYHYILSKKKDNEALSDAEKLLPIDGLGVVMIVHGEEFGDDSGYGTSLVKLGRAHCKVATLQEAYALTFQDTFLASLRKFGEEIKEYELQKKKLESRRLSYDAAASKAEKLKGGKKEKDRREAEDEMERAKQRYEETEEDVRAQMHSIQENEVSQHQQLTAFLDMEINFVEQYLDVLRDVKSDWQEPSQAKVTRNGVPIRAFAGSERDKMSSVRSKSSNRSETRTIVQSSDDEAVPRPTLSRRASARNAESNSSSNSPPSRPSSRPASRSSRKRSDSGIGSDDDPDTREKSEKPRRMSVAGWASSAVGSVTGLTKKSKDKDKFAALEDDEDTSIRGEARDKSVKKSTSSHSIGLMPHKRSKSRENTPNPSPKPPSRILKPPSLQEKKVVRAIYDFSGAADELSFNVGDEILVVNEVLEGWWMGELDGRKGLFPTPYVETILSKPALPPRISRNGSTRKGTDSLHPTDGSGEPFINGDGYSTSDLDDHELSAPPLTPRHSPFYGVPSDAASITSSIADEDYGASGRDITTATRNSPEYPRMGFGMPNANQGLAPPIIRRATGTDSATAMKKAPPPPPPPRRTTNAGVGINDYPPTIHRSHSASSASLKGSASSSSASGHDYDTSPFESANELSTGQGAGDCRDFKQNPFKPQGMCNNCFSYHR